MKKIEKDGIIINYSDSLEELASATIELLKTKSLEYKELFNITEMEVIKVNYFDTLNDFREFIYKLRGEKESLPEYAKGTYDNDMVNAYVASKTQMDKLYTASHELFHIFYMKYILKGNYENRIIWYDEGMAQFLSGEDKKLHQKDNFKEYYLKVKESTKIIPKLNELEHGDAFYNESYNGYDLSYLAIRYLNEIMSVNDFRTLMSDFDKIKVIGNNVLNEMFNYFDKKYLNN